MDFCDRLLGEFSKLGSGIDGKAGYNITTTLMSGVATCWTGA